MMKRESNASTQSKEKRKMSINISTNGRAALASVANELAAEKLLRSKKVITSLEQSPPNETSARVTKDLRFVLRTVLKSKEAAPEEVEQAGALLLRVKALGIRREKFRAVNNEVEETENVSTEQPIIVGTNASQVPRMERFTYSSLLSALDSVFGDSWRWSGKDFSQEERLRFLEAVLESKPTSSAVQSLQAELYRKDERGFKLAGIFPLVARFAKEFLLQNGVKDAAKYEDEERAKVEKWIADLDVEMSK
jgi:hypothetical protein